MRTPSRNSDALSAHDDPEVVGVLEYYLAELEADRIPDRASLLAEHPDIAEPLADCLDGLDFLRKAIATDDTRTPWPTPDGCLDDYRLLRLIGRGGMGTVYEAEDRRTGETVAIKVLGPTRVQTDLDRRRFQHEILAVSSLTHPNIVPILSIGSDRGVHYFAMRYIAGNSLAESIARPSAPGKTTVRNPRTTSHSSRGDVPTANPLPLPLPKDPKVLARWMLHAAEALGHAHALGIVHRDVKPANLLLDAEGHLWVADFGLAFVPGLSRLTQSSALVGTLRYMCPEQVEPRRGVVDQRADLYGLGATFYELFTMRPVFEDADRGVLIQRILNEEPTEPRTLAPEIPYDLETILLKLLAKDPARRYPSMADLAEDLNRFCADKPILARRPSLWDRGWTWLERNRSLAVVAVLAAVCCIAMLLVNGMRLTHERDEKAIEVYRTNEAYDVFYTHFAETVLAREPHREWVHRAFLSKAREHYEQRANSPSARFEDRLSAAQAWRRVGDISGRLNLASEADRAYTEAVTRLQQLLFEQPRAHTVKRELAIARNDNGNRYRADDRGTEAETEYERAAELFAELIEQGSQELFDRIGRAGVENNLGLLKQSQHQFEEAKQRFDTARSQFAQIALEQPKRTEFLADAASSSHNLAVLNAAFGHTDEAVRIFRETVVLREQLFANDPTSPANRSELARTQMLCAELLLRREQRDEAIVLSNRAAEGWYRLAMDFPNNPSYRIGLAAALKTFALGIGTR